MSLDIVELVLKVSLVMAMAAAAVGGMRRASAASRHFVWTLAIAGVLLLPLVSLVMPIWHLPIQRPPTIDAADAWRAVESDVDATDVKLKPVSAGRATAPSASISIASLLAFTYVAGVLLWLGRLAAERWKLRRLLACGADVTDSQWTALLGECASRMGAKRAVRLVQCRVQAMPMACGVLHPVVVIPSIADTWDDDRRRAVLLHELAHVVRFDCLTQLLAELAVACYWVHPGAWWIARRLRIERELACDDRVLSSGTAAQDYAGHLLEIAYSLGGGRAPALGVSMARPRQLEGRLRALVDITRNRAALSTGRRLTMLAVMALLLSALAAATTAGMPAALAAQSAPSAKAPARAPEAAAVPFTPTGPGTWQLRVSADGRTAQVRAVLGQHSSYGTTIPLERLEAIAGMHASPGGPVHFTITRDAGSFNIEGTVRPGVGDGTFTFTPSATFAAQLAKRGVGTPTEAQQQALAWSDVGFAFIDELAAQRYARPDVTGLVNAAQHGVSTSFIREMADLGYRLGTVDGLIRLRDHGVSGQFVRDMRAQGLAVLSADDLIRMRDHGLSPELVGQLRTLGYGSITLQQLVTMRDHGITPDYITDLRALGFRNLSLEDLVAARDHGISAEYARDLRGLGYQLSLEDLTRARNHGIDATYVRGLAALGYRSLSLDDLVRLRDHGVSPEYAQEIAGLGYDRASVVDLVHLRDLGLTAARLRKGTGDLRSEIDRAQTQPDPTRQWNDFVRGVHQAVRDLHRHLLGFK